MADKGFDVQDMFAPMNVTVNIPNFFRKIFNMPPRRRPTAATVHKGVPWKDDAFME